MIGSVASLTPLLLMLRILRVRPGAWSLTSNSSMGRACTISTSGYRSLLRVSYIDGHVFLGVSALNERVKD